MKERYFLWALERAKAGRTVWLNRFFRWALPFNAPHGIRIVRISPEGVKVQLPDWRINHNHLGGMHACAMATVCEFASGLCVLDCFKMSEFRLIMHRLEVDYHRRAVPGMCTAEAVIDSAMQAQIETELHTSKDRTSRFMLASQLRDVDGHIVATAEVHWHVKSWNAVRYSVKP